MKRFFMLCFVILILTGCGSSAKDNPGSQSVLWENFSIGTIVDLSLELAKTAQMLR